MRTALFSLLLLIQSAVYAQVTPAENDTLNYTLAGFSVPADKMSDTYLLEIARGHYTDPKLFEKKVILKQNSSTNKIVQLLPAFGEDYTWRVNYLKKNKQVKQTTLYHFRTGYIPFADTQKYRLFVIKNVYPDKGLLIFYDDTRTLRDLKGTPLWFIPNMPGILDSATTVRDLKLTPQGTITFLTASNAYEINYNGKVLWSAPNDGKVSHDTSEFYHHEFTRLANGHYMVESNEYIEQPITTVRDTARLRNQADVKFVNGNFFQKVEYGTLIEYDSEKHVVWSWRSSQYLNKDYFPVRRRNNRTNYNGHMNSFYFDEVNKNIYIGFRNINEILKISYPAGTVTASYGPADVATKRGGNGLFYGQHNAQRDKDGHILLYNNNVAPHIRDYSESYIMLLSEPATTDDTMKTLWSLSCKIDTLALPYSTSGGSVTELDDSTFLVCMASSNRVFIVNKKKEILWNALYQGRDMANDKRPWAAHSGYRISPILSAEKLRNIIFQ